MKRLSEKQRFMRDLRLNFYKTKNVPGISFRESTKDLKRIFKTKPVHKPFETTILMLKDSVKESGFKFIIGMLISFLLAWLLFCWAVMTSFLLYW